MLGKTWFNQIYRDRVNPGVSAQALSHYYESISSPATRAALLATLEDALMVRPSLRTVVAYAHKL